MKSLVLANQKGGVGKSAIATQLAHYAYRSGFSVLVIDLDHQQNTSQPLRKNRQVSVAAITATEIFESDGPADLPAHRFVLIGGDDRLSTLERQGERHNDYASRFRRALQSWERFDLCIVDTNPNPDIRYAAALISAGYVLAPLQLNEEAISGVGALLGHHRYGIGRIRSALNPDLRFLGILPNLVEPTPFQRQNFKALVAQFGDHLLHSQTETGRTFGFIQKRTAIAEAQAAGIFVGDLAKTSGRETWREVRPVFDMILSSMNLMSDTQVSA